MILCVDTKHLKTSDIVQKDLNLGELLKDHTKYFNTVEEALEENYVPLDVSTTIRSMYSNLVVERDTDDGKKYYINLTNIDKFVHKGYDLLMYLTSIGVMHCVNYSKGFDELMLQHSQFCPIGVYNPDPNIINPIVLVHIVMSDEGAEQLKDYLKCGINLVPIRHRMYEGNLKALLDEIVEVKPRLSNEGNTLEVPKFTGGNKDEYNDNN